MKAVTLPLISLLFSAVWCDVFQNGKGQYFLFNGREVKLNFNDSRNLCTSLDGQMPDSKFRDLTFASTLARLAQSDDVWLNVVLQDGGVYRDADGSPADIAVTDHCASPTCAAAQSGRTVVSKDMSSKAAQVCLLSAAAVSKLRQDMDHVVHEIGDLEYQASELLAQQQVLQQESQSMEETVHQMEQQVQRLNHSTSVGTSDEENEDDLFNPFKPLQTLRKTQKLLLEQGQKTRVRAA